MNFSKEEFQMSEIWERWIPDIRNFQKGAFQISEILKSDTLLPVHPLNRLLTRLCPVCIRIFLEYPLSHGLWQAAQSVLLPLDITSLPIG